MRAMWNRGGTHPRQDQQQTQQGTCDLVPRTTEVCGEFFQMPDDVTDRTIGSAADSLVVMRKQSNTVEPDKAQQHQREKPAARESANVVQVT